MSVIFKNTTKNVTCRHHSDVKDMHLSLPYHRPLPSPAIFVNSHTG